MQAMDFDGAELVVLAIVICITLITIVALVVTCL